MGPACQANLIETVCWSSSSLDSPAVLEKMVAMGCGVEEAELDGEEAEKVA
jgi:hypothetical protein